MWRAIRPWLFPVWCIGCGADADALCAACRSVLAPVPVALAGLDVRAAAAYAGPLRTAIVAMKRGERAYLDPLAALVAALVPAGAVLVPVVTTRRRAADRGFDQARELARRAALLRDGTVADVLRKRGGPQRGAGRTARLSASGRFTIRAGVPLPRTALLLDDVVTTGATLRDAAATLARAGVVVAGAIVVAAAPGRETPAAARESDGA